ncbi:nucleoside-diphosphate-sugar epimerase [Pseudorhodobacter sp. 4114]|nr:nucleoside-diphosphate-sugar epimerase [Pseudorhodobacter sp. 4114]
MRRAFITGTPGFIGFHLARQLLAAGWEATGHKAIRHSMDMQPGDVPATWADASLLRQLTGYAPQTDMRDGVARFVEWYRESHCG